MTLCIHPSWLPDYMLPTTTVNTSIQQSADCQQSKQCLPRSATHPCPSGNCPCSPHLATKLLAATYLHHLLIDGQCSPVLRGSHPLPSSDTCAPAIPVQYLLLGRTQLTPLLIILSLPYLLKLFRFHTLRSRRMTLFLS